MSCATPYQEYATRGGYTDFPTGDHRYYVAFTGNGYTDLSRTEELARKRAAEVAQQEGYDYFRVLETYQNNSTYSARAGVGGATDRVFERPITVLIVKYYSSRPAGENVYTPKDVLS